MPDRAAAYKEHLDTWQASTVRAYKERVAATGLTMPDVARRARENREARQAAIRKGLR